MHLQRRRLELTNLDGAISASEHHRKKPSRSWSTIDFGRAPSLSKWSSIRRMARWKREARCTLRVTRYSPRKPFRRDADYMTSAAYNKY